MGAGVVFRVQGDDIAAIAPHGCLTCPATSALSLLSFGLCLRADHNCFLSFTPDGTQLLFHCLRGLQLMSVRDGALGPVLSPGFNSMSAARCQGGWVVARSPGRFARGKPTALDTASPPCLR
jgi:hypothetical protein